MSDTDDVVWLTYDALAARLGITPESCRNLVRRRRWARRDGNDGARRIGVPHEYLSDRDAPAPAPINGAADGTMNPPARGEADGAHDGGMGSALTALERHIARLEVDLAQAREYAAVITTERDEARAALNQIEVLRAYLEAERSRATAAELDRDRWHAARLAEAERAQTEADAVRQEFAAWKARPWWRRAFG